MDGMIDLYWGHSSTSIPTMLCVYDSLGILDAIGSEPLICISGVQVWSGTRRNSYKVDWLKNHCTRANGNVSPLSSNCKQQTGIYEYLYESLAP